MLIVNSIFIGLVLMLMITSLVERSQNRRSINIKEEQIMNLTKMLVDQNDTTSALANEVNNTVKTSAKILGMINKINAGVKKDILEIDHDMGNVIQMIKHLTHAQQAGMKAHNELVNYTVEELGKIWCDLCEDECDACPFENTCKNWDSTDGSENPCLNIDDDGFPQPCEPDLTTPSEDEKPFIIKDYDQRSCSGSMTINPGDPKQLDKLLDKMRDSGMPEVILKRYKAAIEKALEENPNHPDRLDIVWKAEPVDSSKSFKRVTNPIKNENKLIDPNSKIVKSLEHIYKESK